MSHSHLKIAAIEKSAESGYENIAAIGKTRESGYFIVGFESIIAAIEKSAESGYENIAAIEKTRESGYFKMIMLENRFLNKAKNVTKEPSPCHLPFVLHL